MAMAFLEPSKGFHVMNMFQSSTYSRKLIGKEDLKFHLSYYCIFYFKFKTKNITVID